MSRFEDAFVICGAFDGTPKTLSYPKRIEVAVQRVGPSEEKTGRSLQSLPILLRLVTIVWYLAGYCTYGFMDIRRPLILLPCISTRTIALIAPIANESQSGRHLINVLAIYQYGTIFCVQGISTAISRPTRRGLELRNFSGRHRVSLDPPTRINRGSKTCSVLMA